MGSIKGVARGHYSTRPKPVPDLTDGVIKKLKTCDVLTKEELKYYKKFSYQYWAILIGRDF